MEDQPREQSQMIDKETARELSNIIRDSETEQTEVLDESTTLNRGNEYLDSEQSETNVILRNLIHLPEKAPDIYGNTKERIINGLLKTAGVIYAGLAIKTGLDPDTAETGIQVLFAGFSLGTFGTSVLQGMIAEHRARFQRDIISRARF